MSGRIVHFEIPFDDGDRARNFYKEAFGWEVNAIPGFDYTLVSTGPSGDQGPTEPGFINGGMMQRSGNVTGTVVTVDVDNIEDALAAVERLGGKTLAERTAVADMGFSAYFSDSEGNVVGLWQNA